LKNRSHNAIDAVEGQRMWAEASHEGKLELARVGFEKMGALFEATIKSVFLLCVNGWRCWSNASSARKVARQDCQQGSELEMADRSNPNDYKHMGGGSNLWGSPGRDRRRPVLCIST
jgi:hypothetical protein